jgi:predicted small metal-binding protein
VCDCGYHCQGDTLAQRVGDAQRHARDAHGIEVTAEQILTQPEAT